MQIQQIKHAIKRGIQEERRTGWLASELRKVALRSGKRPSSNDSSQIVTLIQQYVEAVPDLLESIQHAAWDAGWGDVVDPLLEIASEYFLDKDDLIPDHLGLGGLIDDAYLAIGLMRAASKQVKKQGGMPLLADELNDLVVVHAVVRSVMGPEIVAKLNRKIDAATAQDWFGTMLRRIRTLTVASFPLKRDPHPLWGNASTKDIVDTQIGGFGIYPSWSSD